MDTGVEVYLAPDHGPQEHTYYTVCLLPITFIYNYISGYHITAKKTRVNKFNFVLFAFPNNKKYIMNRRICCNCQNFTNVVQEFILLPFLGLKF